MKTAFPHTWERLSALPDGEAAFEHMQWLEGRFAAPVALEISPTGGPDRGTTLDCDVAVAGGGLSLLYAAYLARRGLAVVVFDRRRIGAGHREWNISARELAPLAASGLFEAPELDALVRWRYETGLIRWHGGPDRHVKGVLDCAIDAEALLTQLRARAEAAGAVMRDHQALAGYRVGPGGVTLRFAGTSETLSCRVLLDGTGAASPHARFDLVCPTVGGVLTGLDAGPGPHEVDPATGEILVTTEHVEDGAQHIWEGFPQSAAATTVYLFHYTEPRHLGPHPLLGLFERFFATLPRYKRGEALLTKPTYGFIPAYTRLRPVRLAPADGVLLVGDAASRHSPLTFCGFGSAVRSFRPVCDALVERLEAGKTDARSLEGCWREPPCLGVMGVLALMMVGARFRPSTPPAAINALLDAAFASLEALGPEPFARFLRDETSFAEFVRFMAGIVPRRGRVFAEAGERLSAAELVSWTRRAAAFGLADPRRMIAKR